MINLAILFAVLLVTAYLTNYFLVRSFLGFRWRIFVAPGVIIHELSHAIICILMFAKITKISFFDKDGGSVTHQKSPIPVLGPILISVAPLVAGIVLFYFLGKTIHIENSLSIPAMFDNLKMIYRTIDFSSWYNIVIIYLLLSVAVTMTPSWQDLVNMLTPLIILVGVFYALIRFTDYIHLDNYAILILRLLPVLNLAVFILFICLIISLVLYGITKLIFRT